MIQFNLLPDVKLEYLKSERLKRTTVSIAAVAAAVSLTLLIMLFLVVDVFQKQHLNAVNKDIATNTKKLQSIPDLNKILTIQNQLNSLPGLHAAKPVTSRLFTYLGQIVPAKVDISGMTVDFDAHTINFNGTADSLATVNTFVDTLKFTTFSDGQGGSKSVFSEVVLSSFSSATNNSSYSVTANFDQAIFDSSSAVTLVVPNKITTRSETEKPANLFRTQTLNSTSTQ